MLPIHIASGLGHAAAIKKLLDHGADINRGDQEGLTAFDYAERSGTLRNFTMALVAREVERRSTDDAFRAEL